MKIFNSLIRWLRILERKIYPCPVCFSFLVKNSGMCQSCETRLQNIPRGIVKEIVATEETSKANETVAVIENYCLWEWMDEHEDVISPMLIWLKNRDDLFYQHTADLLISAFPTLFLDSVLIPAPRGSEAPDHAFYLAKTLAKSTGAELLDPLRKTSVAKQKKLNRRKRQRMRIQCVGHMKNFQKSELRFKKLIIVDDLVTTGTTALKSAKALRRYTAYTEKIIVLSLFRRP